MMALVPSSFKQDLLKALKMFKTPSLYQTTAKQLVIEFGKED